MTLRRLLDRLIIPLIDKQAWHWVLLLMDIGGKTRLFSRRRLHRAHLPADPGVQPSVFPLNRLVVSGARHWSKGSPNRNFFNSTDHPIAPDSEIAPVNTDGRLTARLQQSKVQTYLHSGT